jgi:hypothetical protein
MTNYNLITSGPTILHTVNYCNGNTNRRTFQSISTLNQYNFLSTLLNVWPCTCPVFYSVLLHGAHLKENIMLRNRLIVVNSKLLHIVFCYLFLQSASTLILGNLQGGRKCLEFICQLIPQKIYTQIHTYTHTHAHKHTHTQIYD